MIDALLDEAARAEQAGSPAGALEAYRAVLPWWRGEPFADAPYATWVQTARAGLQSRYTAAAVRAGELLLAAREIAEARRAAVWAITADPYSEVAHQLHIRSYVADGDGIGAGRALEACRAALRELDVEPQAATVALIGAR
jgi:DNA-binding SARP family transcriptional activator